ncbi:hypothetical protein HNQ50_003656 [Silvimonas terrae]|uniref:Uncharacterized protein n=1 Tax=Silvimonas terrae TaxID=300266 RepID=A0A840RL11_9NEIS|nr:hypothetical protein [Silvimonas terrae]MBB5192902.1 hypothetical protein [Silvimonas terrae]
MTVLKALKMVCRPPTVGVASAAPSLPACAGMTSQRDITLNLLSAFSRYRYSKK